MKNLNEIFETTKNISIQTGFDELANYLMNECVLDINDNEYRIAEIEFYYFDEKEHQDIFTHCNDKQKENNKFYFHGSGMDITFGNNNYFGGILIRSLIDFYDNTPIIGPWNVFNEILHKANENKNKLDLKITLKEKEQPKKNFLKSCRVGLNLNNDNNCKEFKINSEKIKSLKEKYIFEPYRYILNNEELILKLLYKDEPTFLAWFLRNEKFNSQEANKRISILLENLTKNKDSFLKIENLKKKELRNFFILKKISKN